MRFCWFRWLLLLLSSASCSRLDEPSCAELLETDRFESAIAMCQRDFEATGDAQAGARAARACYELERPDCVFSWGDRLKEVLNRPNLPQRA